MNILIFAPHPDDEVLGCGGTIARLVSEGNCVYVCIVTKGMPPVYNHNDDVLKKPHSLIDEIEKAHSVLGISKTFFLEYPAVMLETVPRYQLNKSVMDVVLETEPDVIFTPNYCDMQKDHAVTTEAVMVAVRPRQRHIVQSVYAYETLSETEWGIASTVVNFIPNVYMDISKYLKQKLDVMACYKSQLHEFPDPRSLRAVTALAEYRGSTMGSRAAEAFMLIREYRKEF